MEPGALDKLLKGLPSKTDPALLVGFDHADDACVYRINDEVALILTMDFFPSMVDDPYMFGQIAAANSLSDVYAMGGEPRLAMNLLCVRQDFDDHTTGEILRGGAEKALEANCVIAGGHTIEDPVPKYGLSVTGFVHPDKIWRNTGAQAGDVLVLTKPLGAGILLTARKAEMLSDEDCAALYTNMATLNDKAMQAALGLTVHACTDITGFGLAGHMFEMASGSEVTIRLHADKLPVFAQTMMMAASGLVPGGAYRNRDYIGCRAMIAPEVPEVMVDIAYDPQTSGGLCVSLPEAEAEQYLANLDACGAEGWVIGEVLPLEKHYIKYVC